MAKTKKRSTTSILFLPFTLVFKILVYLITILTVCKEKITKWIYKTNFDTMSGVDFEEYVVSLLKQNHFHHVEMTKASNDYGIDILAMKEDYLYAIQCKKYQSRVGIEAVRQASTGCIYYDQDIPVVLTNSTFSSQAVKLAKTLEVELWDQQYLHKLQKNAKHTKRRKRIIVLFFIFLLVSSYLLVK